MQDNIMTEVVKLGGRPSTPPPAKATEKSFDAAEHPRRPAGPPRGRPAQVLELEELIHVDANAFRCGISLSWSMYSDCTRRARAPRQLHAPLPQPLTCAALPRQRLAHLLPFLHAARAALREEHVFVERRVAVEVQLDVVEAIREVVIHKLAEVVRLFAHSLHRQRCAVQRKRLRGVTTTVARGSAPRQRPKGEAVRGRRRLWSA